jgi:membrane protein DedA with SNARE-associated domain/rhodanese-related sulfurtransferase
MSSLGLTVDVLSGSAGLLLVFLNVLFKQAGLPIPAVPTLLVAGALAVRQPLWGVAAITLATTACIAADIGWYCGGRAYGNRIIRLLCRVSLSPDSCVSETHARFERLGVKALIFAKFVPGLSAIAAPLAGALRMRFRSFLSMTAVGGLLWVAAYVAVGALAAQEILALLPRLGELGARAAALIASALVLYVLLKWLQRRRFYSALRMARVSVQELRAMMGREPPPVVADVRSSSARSLDPRSIPGALQVPPEEVARILATLDHGGEVVLYCTCPNEASAARVAQLLMKHGVVRVRPLQGGLDAWIAAGYPVVAIESPVAVPSPAVRIA